MSDPQCSPVPTHTYRHVCAAKSKPAQPHNEMCREAEFVKPERYEEKCRISVPLMDASCRKVLVPAETTTKIFKLDFYANETEDDARARLQLDIDNYAKFNNLRYIKAYFCE